MRAVFINHCHPDTPHVCATRMREFAYAMAGRGHEVILFTETLQGLPEGEPVTKTAERLKGHSFNTPFHMDAAPSGFPLLKMLRLGRLPRGLRQAVIFWYFWRHQGVFTDWRTSARPYLRLIASEFKPDIIWSTFGGTDCWNIAKDLSELAACPWVADIKDLWHVFIPAPFKTSLANFYSDAVALTTFSELHRLNSATYFQMESHVLYSGLDATLMKEAPVQETDDIQISLTGGIYHRDHLETLLETLSHWSEKMQATGQRVRLVYAGAAENDLREVASKLNVAFDIEYRSYLNIESYFSLLKSSTLNMYIRSEGAFHHKVFELMASGKPALCYPAESTEVVNEFEEHSAQFHSCNDPQEILGSLENLGSTPNSPKEIDLGVDWAERVETLEQVLIQHLVENEH